MLQTRATLREVPEKDFIHIGAVGGTVESAQTTKNGENIENLPPGIVTYYTVWHSP